ncbi:MAG: AMP-binding protein [Gammaproteobacteria bacterium]
MISLSEYVAAVIKEDPLPVALHEGRLYRSDQFVASVGHWAHDLQTRTDRRYALYTHRAYPFAVVLFGLLHAGKEIWIPGNNLPDTARQLQRAGCRLLGDWPDAEPFDTRRLTTAGSAGDLEALPASAPRIILFTSGSSGEPKAVPKTLRQLQAEINALEALWGSTLEKASAMATVSHQHIYGLLFRLLWPLSAGRCFHSPMFLSPEAMLAQSGAAKSYWVASPAHLKRLDEHSPWQGIAELSMIFSSGGPLPADAGRQILLASGRAVTEVYGSTETGGLAWRQASGKSDAPWQPFAGICLTRRGEHTLLNSPYLPDRQDLRLDDRLTLLEDGRLLLHGRQDRIVKIEEKRLSLSQMEQRLLDMPWISAAYAVVLARHRDVVGVALVLSESGKALLDEQGRPALIKGLRRELSKRFEAVVLPRKWLFVNAIPLTAEGKINRVLLAAMMSTDTRMLPRVLACAADAAAVRLSIKVPKELGYFPNHFPGFPLLPGVVQIGWAEYFGKIFFKVAEPFSHMEAVKFSKMIHPNDELELNLEWREAAGKLYFSYRSGMDANSSGRLVYGAAS